MATTVLDSQIPDTGLGEGVVFPTPGQIIRMRMRRHKGFLIGGIAVLLTFLVAIFAPFIAPHDPYHQDLNRRMIPPIWQETAYRVAVFFRIISKYVALSISLNR